MAPSLTIDPASGSLRIAGCSLVLSKGLPKARAAAELSHLYRFSIDHRNGYQWLSFHGVSFGGQPGGFALGFHLGTLEQVHLGVSLPSAEMDAGCPTRRAIEQEVAFTREELAKQLSRSFQSGQERFSWGSAWSVFDQKGFQASAGVRYET